jgi:hypothetical protein
VLFVPMDDQRPSFRSALTHTLTHTLTHPLPQECIWPGYCRQPQCRPACKGTHYVLFAFSISD